MVLRILCWSTLFPSTGWLTGQSFYFALELFIPQSQAAERGSAYGFDQIVRHDFLEQRAVDRLALCFGTAQLIIKGMGRDQSRSFAKSVRSVAAPSVVAGAVTMAARTGFSSI